MHQHYCTELLLLQCGLHALTSHEIGYVLIGPRGHDTARGQNQPGRKAACQ